MFERRKRRRWFSSEARQLIGIAAAATIVGLLALKLMLSFHR